MSECHVVPDRREGGWKIIGAGTSIPATRAETQADAIDAARDELRRDGGGEVLIHGIAGSVQEKRTVSP